MTLNEKQISQQRELHTKLWGMANALRGSMDAIEFKSYILGVIFYRFLSDKTEKWMENVLRDDEVSFEEAWRNDEIREGLISESLEALGFVIEPEMLFTKFVKEIIEGSFDISKFHKAINDVEDSTRGYISNEAFEGLFEDMDLTSSKLGRDVKSRSKLMGKVIMTVDSISFGEADLTIDILGDAYEYLIGMFAQTAGKKAGEFFSPKSAVETLSRIVTLNRPDILSVYDPTCGSAGLLLEVGKHSNVRTYWAQELGNTTYNLARMNMIIHNIPYTNFLVKNGDTLEHPYFEDKLFDVQIANPPYSANWSADPKFLEDDRFSQYGRLAPKSKADFAFVQHMVYHMSENGVAAILLPHGVLFRGASEGAIREYMIKELNVIDAVIGFPPGCFVGTSIPVCCLVLKKGRANNEDILFIDASKEYVAGKPINKLSEEQIDKIVETYKNRENVEKYAHVATMDEIKENGYNLNIPRYVDTFEKEDGIDIEEKKVQYVELEMKSKELDAEILDYFAELGI